MKDRDFWAEEISDIKNLYEDKTIYPGQFTTLELGVFYPCGFVP